MRFVLPLAIFALCAARLPADAQTNAPPPETAADATPAPVTDGEVVRRSRSSVAEAALRDGLSSLAFAEATNALATAETPEAARHAFEVAAAGTCCSEP